MASDIVIFSAQEICRCPLLLLQSLTPHRRQLLLTPVLRLLILRLLTLKGAFLLRDLEQLLATELLPTMAFSHRDALSALILHFTGLFAQMILRTHVQYLFLI